MMLDVNSVRLLKNDILFRHIEHTISDVIDYAPYLYSWDQAPVTMRCEVLGIGPDVTEVEVGDIVVIDYLDKTDPMYMIHNGSVCRVMITDESKVLFVE